ncbi:unnamed protein product [Rotaria sp. Silwood2]|nr:unnamed protein product [Rotaria sp. Silwood2]CAF3190021.1 unnamed protein product [Rotaria sp. Silwood2]CAF3509109.1 unnamed protein product [Rotaria sp. Silwood2]CAF4548902.1 unnamed protein product [Rotaria sp. Silwood2]CAF4559692.1 unnamed protein product [Rotaria sp. Silwood2]
MITVPLSAGELNRPLVGETEKLLVDIMYRAHTIPFLICAMTIDEIDGLVPKRDNNAQQSKVDGISVLLSHIEGVKNIPNLIVFGATNRRNMMDEAFLRRMQAKVFVGRPSPATRKNMLNPLICKSKNFTSKLIDALVKVTTNFSGAAVGALRSSIVVEMDRNPNINDRRLLELADTVAREHNVWFGISTLPAICRLNPKIFDSKNEDEQFSLDFRDVPPSGRILIDLLDRKCLIELQEDEPTLERNLDTKEITIQSLLARLIQGCSTRNIDTLQVIDLNFLTKQNATDENQIFESLTTLFLECDEYNKSMLVFDIDSLIMLNKSDSEMTKSTSISNIRLYQFIREKCKETIVEKVEKRQENEQDSSQNDAKPVEKWIVIIVKDDYLKSTLINDIEFKKTTAQIDEEQREKEKCEDDERSRKCPKCFRDYIPKDTKFGDCHYHDGFVIDCDKPIETSPIAIKEARLKMQQAELMKDEEENATVKTPLPKLVWSCCLHRYGSSHPECRISKCGLPEELEDTVDMKRDDYMKIVEEHFMKNQVAVDNTKKFIEDYKKRPKSELTSAAKNK